jgi:hypothetical protein
MNFDYTRSYVSWFSHAVSAAEDLATVCVTLPLMLFPWLAILAVLVDADLPNI